MDDASVDARVGVMNAFFQSFKTCGTIDEALADVHLCTAAEAKEHESQAPFSLVGSGRVTAELTADRAWTNKGGTLHGAVQTLIVDILGSVAVFFACLEQDRSVPLHLPSAQITVSFVRPAPLNTKLLVHAVSIQLGSRLAVADVNIVRADNGKLVASGRHTMAPSAEVNDKFTAALRQGVETKKLVAKL